PRAENSSGRPTAGGPSAAGPLSHTGAPSQLAGREWVTTRENYLPTRVAKERGSGGSPLAGNGQRGGPVDPAGADGDDPPRADGCSDAALEAQHAGRVGDTEVPVRTGKPAGETVGRRVAVRVPARAGTTLVLSKEP